MWTAKDYQFMSRAIQLAKHGQYTCDPNPIVGCVITKKDCVIAEGWHELSGNSHAEINALNTCDDSEGSTMYVTLEPRTYQGKTPPCVDALVDAKVKTVIISMVDPNPKVSGLGISRLKQAGILVKEGLLESETKKLNIGFIKRMTLGLPYITCKMAQSLDGGTALTNGNSQWITSDEARNDVHHLRAASSAILTSAETIIRDDPRLNPRDLDFDFKEPIRVIIDRNFRVPQKAKIFDLEGKTVIYTQIEERVAEKEFKNRNTEVVFLPKSETWLNDTCRHMANEYEVNNVLVESGATFAGTMIDEGLIDQLVIYIAPKLLGSEALPLFRMKQINEINLAKQYEFIDIRKVGKDLRLVMKKKKQ